MIDPLHNYRARTSHVEDGNTLDVEIDLGFGISYKTRVKLARVEAWAKKGSEREQGLAAEGYIRSQLHKDYSSQFPLFITIRKRRNGQDWRAEIWLPDGTNISDALVREGHGEYL